MPTETSQLSDLDQPNATPIRINGHIHPITAAAVTNRDRGPPVPRRGRGSARYGSVAQSGIRAGEHLPDCPAAWQAITIEHLLTHTNGLFDYNDLTEAEIQRYAAEFGDKPTSEPLLQVFVDRPLEFTPGSKWKYSNRGYDLLGLLVERLSGWTFGEFDCVGRRIRGRDPVLVSGRGGNLANGGMYSTVADLSRWNQFLLTGEPTIAAPKTPRPATRTTRRHRQGHAIRVRHRDPRHR